VTTIILKRIKGNIAEYHIKQMGVNTIWRKERFFFVLGCSVKSCTCLLTRSDLELRKNRERF